MSATIEQVFELAKQLSPSDRCVLADRLLESVDPDQLDSDENTQVELHPAWAAEIARRVEELESGKVQGIPWEEVQREMHERLKNAKTA